MKKMVMAVLMGLLSLSCAWAQKKDDLKVLISVDMEGVTGVANWEDVSRTGKDYDYFRKLMTLEANAAIEGAAQAGATDIFVRDAHGSARNILPDLLDKRARLIRDWSGDFKVMMEGIDESFDAAMFVGYHGKAGTPNGILSHTMSSRNIADISLNGISLPEAGINALIAGYYGVPVVFVAGEKAVCEQALALFGRIETVAVKEGVGMAAIGLHPEVAREKIQAGTEKALRQYQQYKPYRLEGPYSLVVKYKNQEAMDLKASYPGTGKTGSLELTYQSQDFQAILKAVSKLY